MHCISAILANIKDLNTGSDNSILFETLGQDIIAVASTEDLLPKSFFLRIRTDYFGGFGEQEAEMWVIDEDGNESFVKKYDGYSAIDEALKEFGVIAEEGKDEFDTIHLGRYRTIEDFCFIENPFDDYRDEYIDFENEPCDCNSCDAHCYEKSDIFSKHKDSSFFPHEPTEEELQDIKSVCECGNDTFRVYVKVIIDDARLFCSKCGKEWY